MCSASGNYCDIISLVKGLARVLGSLGAIWRSFWGFSILIEHLLKIPLNIQDQNQEIAE
jgi:hypothetical protein